MFLSLFYLHLLDSLSFHLIMPAGLLEKTAGHFTKLRFIEKFEITECSDDWSHILLVGPKAEGIGGKEMTESLGGFSWIDRFYPVPFLNAVLPKKEMGSLKAKYSQLISVPKEVIDLLRIESGVPEYGVDIDETHILLEANLPHAYKRNKGCYPGQEVIERILAYGGGRTPKKLVPLNIEGEHPLERNDSITVSDGTVIGFVTSSRYDPDRKRTYLLAYLDQRHIGAQLIFKPTPRPSRDPG
jgi:folate-binding protein YgfZ